MDTFFKHASPTTLASLLADLQNCDEWTTAEQTLHDTCAAELIAIVGSDEADEMLLAAGAIIEQ